MKTGQIPHLVWILGWLFLERRTRIEDHRHRGHPRLRRATADGLLRHPRVIDGQVGAVPTLGIPLPKPVFLGAKRLLGREFRSQALARFFRDAQHGRLRQPNATHADQGSFGRQAKAAQRAGQRRQFLRAGRDVPRGEAQPLVPGLLARAALAAVVIGPRQTDVSQQADQSFRSPVDELRAAAAGAG